ncbi:MAG: MerR family transcriptional regulator [Deltaproteobacteria bacterium]|nr:MerR family transcriptional regulator [Deltaproteobacteria bacterium]
MLKLNNGEIMSAGDLVKKLNITQYKLDYLFQSRRLKDEDFQRFGGRRIYKEKDIAKIKQALYETHNK